MGAIKRVLLRRCANHVLVESVLVARMTCSDRQHAARMSHIYHSGGCEYHACEDIHPHIRRQYPPLVGVYGA